MGSGDDVEKPPIVQEEPPRGGDLAAAWEEHADLWTSWARKPDHDSYWRFGRDAFLALLPPAGRLTLDVGCGEGRLSRDLRELGHRVVRSIDPRPSSGRRLLLRVDFQRWLATRLRCHSRMAPATWWWPTCRFTTLMEWRLPYVRRRASFSGGATFASLSFTQ